MKNIPVITISRPTLAEAYEAALVAVYEKGTRFKTQYDKPGDPLSIDCTMNMTILEPETDPVIHMAFPGGIEDLKEYVLELKGYKNHWVKNINDEKDTRWEYTYHGRLAAYGTWQELRAQDERGRNAVAEEHQTSTLPDTYGTPWRREISRTRSASCRDRAALWLATGFILSDLTARLLLPPRRAGPFELGEPVVDEFEPGDRRRRGRLHEPPRRLAGGAVFVR